MVATRSSSSPTGCARWPTSGAARRKDDLITDLVRARDRGDAMSDDEIIILVAGLLGAGSETTAIGGLVAILTLLEHPDTLERLRADRSLLPNAVKEILRYAFGGGGGLPRYAVRDFELRGKQICKGQMLMLSFTGAHRDPSVFPDPDRFDIDRDTTDLTIFGQGPHYCLGVHLALAEMRCMLDAALDFLPPGARHRRIWCTGSGWCSSAGRRTCPSTSATEQPHGRPGDARPDAALRRPDGGRHAVDPRAGRAHVWPPRIERRRQDYRHQDAHDAAAADQRYGDGRGLDIRREASRTPTRLECRGTIPVSVAGPRYSSAPPLREVHRMPRPVKRALC